MYVYTRYKTNVNRTIKLLHINIFVDLEQGRIEKSTSLFAY